jgi:hypothetical protein
MTTPLDALAEALRDSRKYASGAEAPPAAILWCDPGSEFAPVLPLLRARLPNLLTLGDYDPEARTGPAPLLRAAAGRHIAGLDWPPDEPAIIYLPGCGREILRGAGDCPPELAPLVWFAVAAGARLDSARLSRGAGQPGRARHSRRQGDARGARPGC